MNIKLGEIIVEKRKQINLTQQDLADRLGVSNTAVSKWENDINYPDISLIQPLCELLNIDIIKLLNIEEKKKFNIYKYLTIIFIIIIFSLVVSFIGFTNKKESLYEISKVSLDNQLLTINGIIIKNEKTNNLLIYNFIDNDNNIGTTKQKTIKKVNIIINNKSNHIFSNSTNLIKKINNSIIKSKEVINDIKLEITYVDKYKKEQTKNIQLNINNFE